jgi:molybdenum cofactor guanylyltransferase
MNAPSRPAAVVLAGGRSSRFGMPKHAAPFLGKPMLRWILEAVEPLASEVIVMGAYGVRLAEYHAGPHVRVISDPEPYPGPLAALTRGLEATGADLAFALSCDAPLLQSALLQNLADRIGEHDAIVPRIGGLAQPLCAVYRVEPTILGFRASLARRGSSLIAALDTLDVLLPDEAELRDVDPHLLSFSGANSQAELEMLEVRVLALGIVPPD